MHTEAESAGSKRSPVVDAHTHIFCWGENPREGFLSEQTRSSRVTRLLLRLTGITREPGDTLSDKLRNRLLRELEGSSLDYAVVLAQDAVYRPDGSRNDAATHFYVSNDVPPARLPYVFRTDLFPAERSNPLDLDLCIKRTFRFGEDYESRILSLLNLKNGLSTHVASHADRC